MYMISDWIVDGINNKLYKFTNDIIEGCYDINISKSIGDAGIAVGTDEATIAITCPTAGQVAWFDIGTQRFTRYTTVSGTPIGICEGIPYGVGDTRAPYFVANYSTNTVSIIKEGIVVQTIEVGKGPRSLATDGYGRIYVANFNSYTVSVLAPTESGKYVVYNTIPVDKYPESIAVNFNDDVFVVCRNSIIKIRKNNSKIKFTITGNPVNICGDKYGNMWYTNITDNSVSRISIKEEITSYISGGVGPTYICSDRTGDVICLNTGDKTLTRINESGDVINTVQLGFLPMANGDFIGFMSRVNILDDISKKDEKKIEYDDLSDDLKERIDQGGVDPETLILKSDNITYTKAGFLTVTEAINSLIYEYSNLLSEDIKRFDITPAIAELGSTVNSVTFNYQITNIQDHGISMAEINDGVGIVPLEETSYELTGLDITEDKEYKLTVFNDVNCRGEAFASVKFDRKMYYGINSNISLTAIDILHLSNNEFLEDDDDTMFEKNIEFTNGNGYLYIAVPSSLGITINDLFVNNFKDSNWYTTEINFTNVSGHSEMNTVFRSGYTHNVTGYKIFASIVHSK